MNHTGFKLNIQPGQHLDTVLSDLELTLSYRQIGMLVQDFCHELVFGSELSSKAAKENLSYLVEEEVIECEHNFTEQVEVEDDRWFDSKGNMVERSNPDQTRCIICGKILNPKTKEWVDEN